MKMLVVDGNADVAEKLATGLAGRGWGEVGHAANSDDAIEWINAHGGCDVLITEVYLQPADGFTLRETIQPHLPGMITVFTSNYDVSPYMDRMAGCQFLPAPTDATHLDSLLRQLTGKTPAPAAVPAAAPPPALDPAAMPKVKLPAAHAPNPRVSATPVAQAVPRVAATPKPVPANKPTGTPTPVSASPVAVTATPKATPAPAPAVSVAAPSLGTELELPPDDFVGNTLGNYHIEAKIGQGPMGPIYRAKQTNIDRKVRLYILDRAAHPDTADVECFNANASAKAKATNPVLISVYEAGEENGAFFYSCEYVPCRSLAQLKESGNSLDETTALATLKATAEALDFFGREKIAHDLITENSILIGPSNRIRIANIASAKPALEFDHAAEMRRLGEITLSALPSEGADKARSLASSLLDDSTRPASWAAFLQTVAASQPKTVIADAYKLDAQDRAAIRAVEESKKRQKRGMLINSAVSLSLLAIALVVLYIKLSPKGASARADLDKLIEIPAGEFIYQNGEKVTLPTFYISEHEVTIADYAKFLNYLETHPDEAKKFEHEKQPKGKSHVPNGWADMKELNPPMPGYYTRAIKWGKFHDAALDVNSPVFGVDWFDAYAYAKWKGRRLPTEQEWEKAGRGTDGRTYPWGKEPLEKGVNTGIDMNSDPNKGGEKDGWDRWSPVDAMKNDKSPYGVMGMAGNVSEWTGSYDVDPMMPGNKIPVIRGGNYKNLLKPITERIVKFEALQNDEPLGFRTASDSPQPTK